MTNHDDALSVSPDPVQAEELRQRLLARMARVSRDDHHGRPDLHLESDRVEPDEGDVPMNDLSAPDTSTSSNRTHGRRMLVAAAAIIVVIAAAVVAIRIEDPARVATTAPTPTTAPPAKRCPFTAEQVGEVIGVTITGPESSTDCNFGTGVPSLFNNVSFRYQPASACTPESLRNADGDAYSDAVDGLGVDAYSKRVSLGVSLLVCNGDQPFEVVVDGVQGDPLAGAVTLAKLVLNG
jgi:hypothetical protein